MFDINTSLLTFPTNNREDERLNIKEFPFVSYFSLAPIIEKWKNLNKEQHLVYGGLWEGLEKWLDEVPELLEPTLDYDRLQKHRDIIKLLLSPIFPNDGWSNDYKAIAPPFRQHFFHTTPELSRFTKLDEATFRELERLTLRQNIFNAYKSIFKQHYQFDFRVEMPVIFPLKNTESNAVKYFKVDSSDHYYNIQAVKPLPELSSSDFKYLISNYRNLSVWMDYLPPNNFIFTGFTLLHLSDITREQVLAQLKTLLTGGNNVSDDSNFEEVQHAVSTFLQHPNINLGIATLKNNKEINFQTTHKFWNSLKINNDSDTRQEDLEGSIYAKVLDEGVALINDNLEEYSSTSVVEKKLIDAGVRSILLTPLYHKEKLIGLLELTSKEAKDIDTQTHLHVKQLIPILEQAIQRHLQSFEQQIETVTKEYFTAIHPTVAWRFKEAAVNIIAKKEAGENLIEDPIVFHDVYPLHASAEIRHSNMAKNAAIQEDMVEQLMLAKEVLSKATPTTSLVLLDEINYKLEKTISLIDKGLNAGDEATIFSFLKTELHPLFRHLQQAHPVLKDILHHYWEYTDTETGILSRKRKAYDQSVNKINEAIAQYLEKQAEEAQEVYPHYFEKYHNNGVEHNIYVGASLINGKEFDHVYLKNLRLKQLMSCCEIGRLLNRLQGELSLSMDVSQFIVVHNKPITIRFKMNEKKFDVEENHNLEYEVIRKRIKEGLVKETRERLAQPNKITIVFTQDEGTKEYLRFIEYLQERHYLLPEIEHLEVDALQGIKDLSAIRVQVQLIP